MIREITYRNPLDEVEGLLVGAFGDLPENDRVRGVLDYLADRRADRTLMAGALTDLLVREHRARTGTRDATFAAHAKATIDGVDARVREFQRHLPADATVITDAPRHVQALIAGLGYRVVPVERRGLMGVVTAIYEATKHDQANEKHLLMLTDPDAYLPVLDGVRTRPPNEDSVALRELNALYSEPPARPPRHKPILIPDRSRYAH